jgi:hypothetical protein
MRQKLDAGRTGLYKRARAVELPTQEAPFRKIRNRRLKSRIATFTQAIRRLVKRPDFDIRTSDLELFCRAQRRTKITEFVVDLGRSFDGLSNFFAEERAIAFA